MKKLGRKATRDLMLLSVVAGSADAAGFMGVGHVFTSNMTGNLVLLGIACGQGQWHEAVKTLYVLLLFMAGVALGSRLTRHLPDTSWQKLVARLLTVEAALLLLFAVCWLLISKRGYDAQFFWLIFPLAVAMGLQSAAMNRLAIAGVSNTAMTGTLTSLAAGLESTWLSGASGEPETRRRMEKQLLVVLLYCGGAVAEGALILHAGWIIGFLPLALVLAVLVLHRKN